MYMNVIIEGKYVEIFHTHPIAKFGSVYPIEGVKSKIEGDYVLSEAGEECRIHTNGDKFVFDGDKWRRIYDIESVLFREKKIFK